MRYIVWKACDNLLVLCISPFLPPPLHPTGGYFYKFDRYPVGGMWMERLVTIYSCYTSSRTSLHFSLSGALFHILPIPFMWYVVGKPRVHLFILCRFYTPLPIFILQGSSQKFGRFKISFFLSQGFVVRAHRGCSTIKFEISYYEIKYKLQIPIKGGGPLTSETLCVSLTPCL